MSAETTLPHPGTSPSGGPVFFTTGLDADMARRDVEAQLVAGRLLRCWGAALASAGTETEDGSAPRITACGGKHGRRRSNSRLVPGSRVLSPGDAHDHGDDVHQNRDHPSTVDDSPILAVRTGNTQVRTTTTAMAV